MSSNHVKDISKVPSHQQLLVSQNNKTKPFPVNSQSCTFIPRQKLIWLELIKIRYYYNIVQDEILMNMPRRHNA